jgi:hypothetical protein
MAAAAVSTLVARLKTQAGHCARGGSPLYALLLEAAAVDVERGGPAAAVLAGHEADAEGSALALRFAGAVHRLVLEGQAANLARHYPSVGGSPGADVVTDFLETLEQHVPALRAHLEHPVQTNEAGRSAALVGGFLEIVRLHHQPLRILEIGASAGLNLRWDRFRYITPHGEFGPPDSRVVLDGFLRTGQLPLTATATVVARRGCDRAPLDPAAPETRLTLMSYVWADQVDRFRVLEGALDIARQVPATVDRADAGEWLEEQLARPANGVTTVVYHSIVLPYLGREGGERLQQILASAGTRAQPGAPLAHLAFEQAGDVAELNLQHWPDGTRVRLARSGFHGRPVDWLLPPSDALIR